MIKFQAKYLPALMKFMAKNDIRYYLNGIHIDPHPEGGAVLVATDGHRMLAIRDKEAVVSDKIVFSVARGIEKLCRKEGAFVTINTETQRLTIETDSMELYLQPGKCLIDGKFPEWRRVVPPFQDLKQMAADFCKPLYLSEAAMIHPDLSRNKYDSGCRFWQVEKNGCVVVEYSGAPEYLAIIMPIRSDDGDVSIGKWTATFGQTGRLIQ